MSEPNWELLGGGGAVGGPIDYVGDWAIGTTYQPGQIVRYLGVDYLAVNPSVGQVPQLASPVPQSMVCLYDSVLSAAAPNFDVQNIPQQYTALMFFAQLRGDRATVAEQPYMRFNNDTGANYDHIYLIGAGGVAQGGAGVYASTFMRLPDTAGGTSPASGAGILAGEIPNYASSIFHKQVVARGGVRYDAAAIEQMHSSGSWRSTTPINRITLYPLGPGNWAAGSRLSIYGLLSAGQSPISTITLAPGGIGTSFPDSPTNGQLFTLVDSLTAPTYAWDFRYVASITSAHKWVFVGGDAKIARAETDYPANPALTLSVPRPGFYNLEHGGMCYGLVLDTIYQASLSTDGGESSLGYTNFRTVGSMAGWMSSVVGAHANAFANSLITQSCNAAGGTRLERRWIKATPVRLS